MLPDTKEEAIQEYLMDTPILNTTFLTTHYNKKNILSPMVSINKFSTKIIFLHD